MLRPRKLGALPETLQLTAQHEGRRLWMKYMVQLSDNLAEDYQFQYDHLLEFSSFVVDLQGGGGGHHADLRGPGRDWPVGSPAEVIAGVDEAWDFSCTGGP